MAPMQLLCSFVSFLFSVILFALFCDTAVIFSDLTPLYTPLRCVAQPGGMDSVEIGAERSSLAGVFARSCSNPNPYLMLFDQGADPSHVYAYTGNVSEARRIGVTRMVPSTLVPGGGGSIAFSANISLPTPELVELLSAPRVIFVMELNTFSAAKLRMPGGLEVSQGAVEHIFCGSEVRLASGESGKEHCASSLAALDVPELPNATANATNATKEPPKVELMEMSQEAYDAGTRTKNLGLGIALALLFTSSLANAALGAWLLRRHFRAASGQPELTFAGMVRVSHAGFARAGWQSLPSLRYAFVTVLVGSLALVAVIAVSLCGLARRTATSTTFLGSFVGVCMFLLVLWLLLSMRLRQRTFGSVPTVNLVKVAGVEYDGSGSFYCASDEAGVYGPRVARAVDGAGATSVLRCRSVLHASALAIVGALGCLVEGGAAGSAGTGLGWAIVVLSALLALEGIASAHGCELAMGRRAGQLVPVDSRVRGAEGVLAASLPALGALVVVVHLVAYGILVTSTWLLPLLAIATGIVYSVAGIHCKGSPLGFVIGSLVQQDVLSKPLAVGSRGGFEVMALSYSVLGPFMELSVRGHPASAWGGIVTP